jgi:hypothetical protein
MGEIVGRGSLAGVGFVAGVGFGGEFFSSNIEVGLGSSYCSWCRYL